MYATPEQLHSYTSASQPAPEPDAVTLRRLHRASSLVDDAIRGAVYATDDIGNPTDARVKYALQLATCAQAALWQANDIDPAVGAATAAAPAVQSKSGAGVSVTYAQDAVATARLRDLQSGNVLDPEAWRVLDRYGLLSTNVQRPGNAADVFPSEWPYDPITGRAVGKYDTPQFGTIGFAND